MRVSHVLAAAALLVAPPLAAGHVEFGNYKDQQLTNEVTSFMVTGEWGGQSSAPFTTPGQLAAAEAMSTVVTSSLSTFVVSPGGNFCDEGIQGACAHREGRSAPGRAGQAEGGTQCGELLVGRPHPAWCPRHPLACLRTRLGSSRATCGWAQALLVGRCAPGEACALGPALAALSPRPPSSPGPTDSLPAQTRLNRTWDDVYNTPYPTLSTLPWYTVAGAVDWAGNVSGALPWPPHTPARGDAASA